MKKIINIVRRFLQPKFLLTTCTVLPFVLLVRLLKPVLHLRFGALLASRIGHFALNTELYLCEKKAGIFGSQRCVDVFYLRGPSCNVQLLRMWQRKLTIWPEAIVQLFLAVNRLVPGYAAHEIPVDQHPAVDIHNLIDRFPASLSFTSDEEREGRERLREMGLSDAAKFVCLIVRDPAYLESHQASDMSYHSYRDCSIESFVLTCEELVKRGIYVIRMGAKASQRLPTNHPMIIDYAFSNHRTEFMDIYLGAKCFFCISTGTGWDMIPHIFRRPLIYTNLVPLGYFPSWSRSILGLTKKHWLSEENRAMSLREIFNSGTGFFLSTRQFEEKNVQLMQNTAEEILQATEEMLARINGTWETSPEDSALQKRFWEMFPVNARDKYLNQPLHGGIRAQFSSRFLRDNISWLS